jgi:hypothetical protein
MPVLNAGGAIRPLFFVADRPGLVVDGLGGTSTSLIRLSAFLALALIEKPFAVLAPAHTRAGGALARGLHQQDQERRLSAACPVLKRSATPLLQ